MFNVITHQRSISENENVSTKHAVCNISFKILLYCPDTAIITARDVPMNRNNYRLMVQCSSHVMSCHAVSKIVIKNPLLSCGPGPNPIDVSGY